MKVWFGVDVDNYAEEEGEELGKALRAAFPDVEVI
jgi:hypothetical protein